ncbi:IucA/IucC family protein [Phytoactinopolyspora halotolerans]|uniref:IucA/IucC family siderophore biosynthesis protein n=1 Tax=Phytoactinopolyspora halotolerans TaxID=1981512 RepID=A0A6L9SHF8_9ACTN|nr:IucA/IucC family siderophore biosynthesis protein [Phytoactinopolyspora halotolerans]NEE03862.1 IucA/IucC family siderophore biosynthesis protein [Phytoactinopolyspora halotolerans]
MNLDESATTFPTWLDARCWDRANRELLAKALTEFMYEEIIDPAIDDDANLTCDIGGGTLTATVRRRALGWWRVDPDSISWVDSTPTGSARADSARVDSTGGAASDETGERDEADEHAEAGERAKADVPGAVPLLAQLLTAHGVAPAVVANLVSELHSTLLSDAWLLARGRPSAEITGLEPVLVESELRGHPWIVAGKGRVGFSADDLLTYAPEAGRDVHLLWLAAVPSVADTRSVSGLDNHMVVREQVGDAEFERLRAHAQLAGLDPDSCVYLPVHPWQWTNRILPLHAAEIARGELVPLGEGSARYRPQLAIRTLTDLDHPERRYLKLPVSVLNTSVYRGLPRERTLAAPALTEWLCGVVDADPFLKESGLILLGEVSSVSVAHRTYESIPDVPYQHTEMLGAIWRESVEGYLDASERAVSLAALLHVDAAGEPFAGELIARSGLSVDEWFRRLHHAVLPPLFHVLYRYGAMFSPHGQNCMIAHRDGVPTRLVVKDFVDDVAICSETLPEHQGLTPQVRSALDDVTLDAKTLRKYLQNGLLICVYRYLAEIAEDRLGLPETSFWTQVRQELVDYRRRFGDELAERFALFDLETPTFPKLCLNRLRLFERGYADDAERPVISAAGVVRNPLAPPG